MNGTDGRRVSHSGTWALRRDEKPMEGFKWKSEDVLTLKRRYLEHSNVPLKLQKIYEPCTCFYSYNLTL